MSEFTCPKCGSHDERFHCNTFVNAPAQGWQPIATAPRKGTHVLVWGKIWAGEISGIVKNDKGEVNVACYFDGKADYPGDWWQCSGGDAYATWCQPTHWMPLPEAPVA